MYRELEIQKIERLGKNFITYVQVYFWPFKLNTQYFTMYLNTSFMICFFPYFHEYPESTFLS